MGAHTIRLTVRVVRHTGKHEPGGPGGEVLARWRAVHEKSPTGFGIFVIDARTDEPVGLSAECRRPTRLRDRAPHQRRAAEQPLDDPV